MDESNAPAIVNAGDVTMVDALSSYSDDLEASGMVANQYARLWVFDEYHTQCTENTRIRQRYDLTVFQAFLAVLGVARAVDDLFNDADAWKGVTYGHIKAFRKWQLDQGYSIGSINVRLATVRKYCGLAHQFGVIPSAEMELIRTVKGYSHKIGRNIDQVRTTEGKDTRKGRKKAAPTSVSSAGLRRLKRVTVEVKTPRTRAHDQLLETRDALLICLLTEHALRCSEIVALDVEHFNLPEGVITIYRQKTDDKGTFDLMPRTLAAAKAYLAQLERGTGPLFTGYDGQRLSTRAVNKRVNVLGQQAGITGLSPHDLRHAWAVDALKHGSTLDTLQAYGGWKSPAMPLHYARVAGVNHGGLKISD